MPWKVQKLVLVKPSNARYAEEIGHVKVGRIWQTMAVCDKETTAEIVARNIRLDGEEIVRIRQARKEPAPIIGKRS